MGVMLVVGAYWAMSGEVSYVPVLVSLPISCLVAAILYANNVRDITHDLKAGVRTVAGRVSFGTAKAIYYALVYAAYVIVIGLVLGALVTPWALGTLLSLPKAMINLKKMRVSREGEPGTLSTLDVETAQLHLIFGMIFAVAIALGGGGRE
jgi:1,4-dihydroxy-2-naphthoate polyprenyltransferase